MVLKEVIKEEDRKKARARAIEVSICDPRLPNFRPSSDFCVRLACLCRKFQIKRGQQDAFGELGDRHSSSGGEHDDEDELTARDAPMPRRPRRSPHAGAAASGPAAAAAAAASAAPIAAALEAVSAAAAGTSYWNPPRNYFAELDAYLLALHPGKSREELLPL